MRHPIDARALAAFLCLIPAAPRAQWAANGVGVTTANTVPATHAVCSDGAGGIVVAWSEVRNGTSDILARKITAAGVAAWNTDGVVVCGATFDQAAPALCPDGNGGAIVTWRDQRNGAFDIYAQHIDAGGAAQWSADGAAVCNVSNNQYAPVLVSDGAGGAVIAWYDFRAMNYDIYAQRVDGAGTTQWTPGGVALCASQLSQYNPVIVSDGAGGAIVAWTDLRNGNADIFARSVTSTGAVQWASAGLALCSEAHDQLDPVLTGDGGGGVIVAWRDTRNGNGDIFAQRVAGAGAVQWAANGVAVCTAALDQLHPAVACDGAGGAVVAWDDARGASLDLYAQRLDALGAPQWNANGAAVCAAASSQARPSLVCDGVSDAIVAWEDRRAGSADVYAQRLNAGGVAQWTANGVVVCNATGDQTLPLAVADGAGGVTMAWKDARSGNLDLYAQRAGPGGGTPTGVGAPRPSGGLVVSAGYPNPFSRVVQFDVDARGGRVVLEVFDVAGRRVARREAPGARFSFDGRDDRGRALPGGVYLCRFSGNGSTETRKIVVTR